MRIGITCYPTYGGSGIVATELGIELARRGHEVHFITYANPIRLDTSVQGIHYHEVEVATYPLFQYPPYTLALASRMAEVAERYSPTSCMYTMRFLIRYRRFWRGAFLPRGELQSDCDHLHGTDITLVGTGRSYHLITKFALSNPTAPR